MSEPETEAKPAADEVEVTPDMVRAGVAEIATYNTDFEDDEDAVTRIYVAMELARRALSSERTPAR